MYARAWFKHVAEAKREKEHNKYSGKWPSNFGCFACVREKGESEVK